MRYTTYTTKHNYFDTFCMITSPQFQLISSWPSHTLLYSPAYILTLCFCLTRICLTHQFSHYMMTAYMPAAEGQTSWALLTSTLVLTPSILTLDYMPYLILVYSMFPIVIKLHFTSYIHIPPPQTHVQKSQFLM